MSQEKYIGMDVQQATVSVAVMDSRGKLIMECILASRQFCDYAGQVPLCDQLETD
jgi:hypothetical protein